MLTTKPEVAFGNGDLEKLERYALKSPEARINVGKLLAKAEVFDENGARSCKIEPEVRCVGQHEVLPVRSGSLYAFVELTNFRFRGEIFLVEEVDFYGDLRRAWEQVHRHFGYDGGPDGQRVLYWL